MFLERGVRDDEGVISEKIFEFGVSSGGLVKFVRQVGSIRSHGFKSPVSLLVRSGGGGEAGRLESCKSRSGDISLAMA